MRGILLLMAFLFLLDLGMSGEIKNDVTTKKNINEIKAQSNDVNINNVHNSNSSQTRSTHHAMICIDEGNKCRLHNTAAKNCPIDWILIPHGIICAKIGKYKCCKYYNKIIFDSLNDYYGKNRSGVLKRNRRKRRNIPSIDSMPNIESRLKRRAIMGKGDARMRVC